MLLCKFNELFYSKKYDECIKFLEDEKKNNQNDQNEINYYISKVYYQLALLSDENEKKSFFDKIEKLLQNNTYDKSKKLLALVYNEESSYDKAIEIYNEIINNGNDKDYKYHVYKANALHNKYNNNNDDLNKIIYDYKRAMNSDSEDIYTNAFIGYCNVIISKCICEKEINSFFDIFEDTKILDKYSNIININFIVHNIIFYLDKVNDKFDNSFTNIIDKICNLDIIWEKEEYFNYIVKPDVNNIYEYKKLWILQYIMLDLLSVRKKGNIDKLCTYISIDVFMKLYKENKSKLKMFSVSRVNDYREGKIINDILYKKEININYDEMENNFGVKKKNISFAALQTSFTRVRDSLTMFRLYGKNTKYSKDDKNEGTGVCLVFNKNFFDVFFKNPSTPISDKKNNVLPIYSIMYYDHYENKLIFNQTPSNYQAIEIGLNETNNYKWNNDNSLKEEEKLKNRIGYIFNKIFEIFIKNNTEREKLKILYKLLINIQYLIKDAAFVEEQEMRILQVAEMSDNDVQYDEDSKTLYKDYLNIFDRDALREVIIGPKVKDPVSLIEGFQKDLENDIRTPYGLKFTISKAPLA
ncbi:DUF2971 domain-containing protein [Brachyspira intermedia]|nr:DUF2971 domain-containing protein [Brachyspira intermedia]